MQNIFEQFVQRREERHKIFNKWANLNNLSEEERAANRKNKLNETHRRNFAPKYYDLSSMLPPKKDFKLSEYNTRLGAGLALGGICAFFSAFLLGPVGVLIIFLTGSSLGIFLAAIIKE